MEARKLIYKVGEKETAILFLGSRATALCKERVREFDAVAADMNAKMGDIVATCTAEAVAVEEIEALLGVAQIVLAENAGTRREGS